MSASQSVLAGWMEIAQRTVQDEPRQHIEDALAALVSEYASTLYRVAFSVLRNAADAALETGGGVTIGWQKNRKSVEVWIDDEGPGQLVDRRRLTT